MADLRELAEFGRYESGVNRRALTPEDIAARAWLENRMRQAGLDARIDGVGSVIGTTPGATRYIVVGSHTDTVPKGGWLDGAMGVIFGLEVARAFVESGTGGDIGIQVMSFNDEEGRFAGLMGSSVFCSLKTLEEVIGIRADDNTTLASALEDAGYAGQPVAEIDPATHIAYLEPHIEQGPLLESRKKKIGIVTEIVGAERCRIRFLGQADHAGTTPMAMRRDAAGALYDYAVRFAGFCREHGGDNTVWNLGNVGLEPGAYNVVTPESTLYIEYRDGSPEILRRIREIIPVLATEICDLHDVEYELDDGVRAQPAAMNETLINCIEAAADKCDAPSLRMPSGAGHDAMLCAPIIPTGMFFVPSIDGRSHDIAEDTKEDDIIIGLRVLSTVISGLVADGSPLINQTH
jgi:N-carbamoyl-L-amino-acid hydrolase